MTLLKDFTAEIDAFLERTGMAPTAFGRLACNDASFVEDLHGGREPRLSTIEKVRRFMAEFEATGATGLEGPFGAGGSSGPVEARA